MRSFAREIGLSARRQQTVRLHPGVVVALCLAALSFQVLLPAYFPLASLLDLSLLVLVYLALLRRNVLIGLLVGMLLGMAQDGLTHGPIGLFGMIKTIIGYSAAAVSTYVEASYTGARAVLAALFYLLHQILFWMIEGSLLGGRVVFDPAQTVILAAIHAGLAILLFGFFDRLQRTSG